jgi:4-hydroxyphenylpyruvate dioxygenase
VREHGDGAHDLAFVVDDSVATYEAAVARGARSVREPYELTDDHGVLRLSAVATYGDTKHTFVDRSDYHGHYCPGFVTSGLPPVPAGPHVGLAAVDHVVGNVEEGTPRRVGVVLRGRDGLQPAAPLRRVADRHRVLGAALDGVWNRANVVMPLNEPAQGKKRSQIQEYLDTYRGPGVQHLAFRTDDIITAIASLRARGVRFLEANDEYYRDVRRASTSSTCRGARSSSSASSSTTRSDGRTRRSPAPAVLRADHRPPHRVRRDHPARRRAWLRRGQLQGAVRVDRA